MLKEEIIAAVQQELDRRGVKPFRAAINFGLPENAIRYFLEGRNSKVSRLVEICQALDLELYVGPPRKVVAEPQPVPTSEYPSGWERKALDLLKVQERLIRQIESVADSSTRQVEIRELAAAAGGGATDLDETITGYVSFQRSWLDRYGLEATHCTVINVAGESMEPTLPNGSKILVDRHQRRRKQGRIYVVRSSDGLVVKRAEKNEEGLWTLCSDHPAWKPTVWGSDFVIVGEVKWMGKTL